jgi:putative spermidine/putrescine transport system permease protein
MLLPGLAAASALVFAFAFGAYEVPLVLGQHAPKALPVLAWQAWTDTDLTRRPEAMAMAVLIALAGVGLLLAYARLLRIGGSDAR